MMVSPQKGMQSYNEIAFLRKFDNEKGCSFRQNKHF